VTEVDAGTRTVPTIAELRAMLDERRAAGASVALVPTMGALHDGHLALVRRARELADVVVVSIFVNPLQFGPGEDLERYPRTLDADVAALAALSVDAVFTPTVDEMYPRGREAGTTVHSGPIGERYEGASRPGHFDGMLTVVAKLFGIAQPDVALFGQKDAQQVHLVSRMVADLDLPLRIETVPTVRESDGLALSSRNRYLSADQRQSALRLSRALQAGRDAAAAGRGAEAALAAGRVELDVPDVRTDYLALTSPGLGPAPEHGPARLLVAATVGSTRLIDNIAVELA
jgi:pantoate--beta-alanine ligase